MTTTSTNRPTNNEPTSPDARRTRPTGTEADWPSQLSAEHRTYQHTRGVGPLIVAERGLYSVSVDELPNPVSGANAGHPRWTTTHTVMTRTGARQKEVTNLGVADHMRSSGSNAMVIPMYSPVTGQVAQLQLRLDTPRSVTEPGSGTVRRPKFEIPGGASRGAEQGQLVADVHPLADPTSPVQLWTEGQAKADACLTQVFREGLELTPVMFTGVTMPYLKAGHEDGDPWERTLSPAVTKGLNLHQLQRVYLAWDADWRINRMVRDALIHTGRLLQAEGVDVRIVDVPKVHGDPKTGIDDYIAFSLARHTDTTPLATSLAGALTLDDAELQTRLYDHSDLGRSLRLADRMRYEGTWRRNITRASHGSNGYMRYVEGIWVNAEGAEVELAKRLTSQDTEDGGATSGAALREAARLAATTADLNIKETDLDGDPNLLNVRNGTVDLLTGELRPHSPSDLCTKQSPFYFHPERLLLPDYGAPRFMQFLEETFGADARGRETAKWLQLKLGASAIGKVYEDQLIQLLGVGSNGKSTLMTGVMVPVFGSYAAVFNPGMLTGEGGKEHEKADLFGVRLAVFSETDPGERLHTSTYKQVAGRETIRARNLFERSFQFIPTHHAWLMTNNLLSVPDSSKGAWRRMALLPFERVVPDDQLDPELEGTLLNEGEGILAWVIAGAMAYHALGHRVDDCTVVAKATRAYRTEEDELGHFITQRLLQGEGKTARKPLVYQNYRAWAIGRGVNNPWSAKVFWKAFRGRPEWQNITEYKSNGLEYIRGAGLLTDH